MSEVITNAIEIDSYLKRLFPIARSLTGDGNRETLEILGEIAPITVREYPVGTKVYDWTIPDEWTINDAWIKDPHGKKVVDWSLSNLHVVGYSEPVKAKMSFDELSPNLYYLQGSPNAIPYRTSYYDRSWGFCVTKNQYDELRSIGGTLDVHIDSAFNSQGSMTIGEIYIEGRRQKEYLVSTYICHPSMANDNLSGMLTTAFLASTLTHKDRPEYSWRFVFIPETIGAIAYLRFNEKSMASVLGGFVVSCCGGTGPLGYKETFLANHVVDRAVRLAFSDYDIEPIRYPFVPDGSDERQYSSPAFRIPITTITKDKYYEYPEYHSSLDNLGYVNGKQIIQALTIYQRAIEVLDGNRIVESNISHGEVQLGKYGLYPTVGGSIGQQSVDSELGCGNQKQLDLLLWILFLADGTKDIIDIAERAGFSSIEVKRAVTLLENKGLVRTK